ncbi:MAG TPA: hypothetical protein VD866_08735 [Urbifossiella sp.]|nr:hypothetical protein [Urbifossiella sp.]
MLDFPAQPLDDGDDDRGSTAPAWVIAGAAGVCYLVVAGLAYRWWVG